jgi:hypothetical protein
MKRRFFNKLLAVTGLAATFKNGWTTPLDKRSSLQLPDVVMNGNSVEICINSRYSFHSGYSAAVNNQVVANTLWAAASAPLMATERTIYLAMADNLYTYKLKDGKPLLEVHATGNKLSESTAAFEIGVATNPAGATEDGGVALHWANLAAIAFWKTKTNAPACCPKDSAKTNAKNKWNPVSEVHCVNCYGQSTGSVAGLVKTLATTSSDKSLPDPTTDGMESLEDAMKNPLFGTNFKSDDLTKEQISQILWASYGCTSHKTISNTPGTSVASYMLGYFLTGRIYLISSAGVQCYYIRKGTDTTTMDHRLESAATADTRSQLRAAVSRLPQTAPVYIVYCGQKVEYKQLIEAGYAGGGALLQATALGLQGHYIAQFTDAERTAIQTACGIPAANVPMLIFSFGKADGTSAGHSADNRVRQSIGLTASPNPFTRQTTFTTGNLKPGTAEVRIYDPAGKLVKTVRPSLGSRQALHWDGADEAGNVVRSGVYTCKMVAPGREASVVVRKM